MALNLATKCRIVCGTARAYLRGRRFRDRIVVIESDDWGGIRVSSEEAYQRLREAGLPMDRSHYSLDALETTEDLERLYEVLESVRDARGRPACVTANMVMANPDFRRIRDSGFRDYFWEPSSETLARDPARRDVPRLFQEGRRRALIVPQFHGREHIAWWQWLEELRRGSAETRQTFDLGMVGVPQASSREGLSFYQPLYVHPSWLPRGEADLADMIRQGADLFEKQFGCRSLSAIAPNYTWTDLAERLWAEAGVRYIQGGVFQILPTAGRPQSRPHYAGERGVAGGWYLVRNGLFDPAVGGGDWVARCLRQVGRAFRFRQPAVIDAHRVNFVGSILPANRDQNLRRLLELLRAIVHHWPDVRFLSTVDLGRMIERGLDRVDALGEAGASDEHPGGTGACSGRKG